MRLRAPARPGDGLACAKLLERIDIKSKIMENDLFNLWSFLSIVAPFLILNHYLRYCGSVFFPDILFPGSNCLLTRSSFFSEDP